MAEDSLPGLTGNALAPLSIQGMPVRELQELMNSNPGMFDVAQETNGTGHFWSTWPRAWTDPTRDVLDLGLGSLRIINRIQFQVAQFPCSVRLEYLEPGDTVWKPVQRENSFNDVVVRVLNSVPSIIKTSVTDDSKRHPQHTGAGHWLPIELPVRPFLAARVRLVLTRTGTINSVPKNLMGDPVDYSLGIRDFAVGYEIATRDDFGGLAQTGQDASRLEPLSTASDLLGSQTAFVVRETRASHVLASLREMAVVEDPEDRIHSNWVWKSEPQPLSDAIVNFYLDLRDENGLPTVLDRIWMDPITSGVSMRIYHSEHVPGPGELSRRLESEEFLLPDVASTGGSNPGIDDEGIFFGEPADAFLDIDNLVIQWNREQPWWLGINLQPQFNSDDPNTWTFFDTREVKIWWEDEQLKIRVFNEVTLIEDINFIINQQVRVVVGWDGQQVRIYAPGNAVLYTAAGFEMVTDQTKVIRFGGQSLDLEDAPGQGNYRLRGFILKQGMMDPLEAELFINGAAGTRFYRAWDDQPLTARSILRIHPSLRDLSQDTSPYGIIGGSPLGFYEAVRWKPIMRDFRLERGYIDINPVRARYLKFEFTNLAVQPYTAPSPLSVWVKQRPPAQTKRPTVFDPKKRSVDTSYPGPERTLAGPGGSVNQSLVGANSFLDQRGLVAAKQSEYEDYTPTEAYYSADPEVQEKLRGINPMFGMIPWTQGGTADGSTAEGVHTYNETYVKSDARVAFFAGLNAIRIYRTDPTARQDSGSYHFDFFDAQYLNDEASGWSLEPPQGLTLRTDWIGSAAAKVSEPLLSEQKVRGLQFATVQSPARQRLTDPEFTDPTLTRWTAYEGAQISISGDFNADLGSLLKVQRKPDGSYWDYLEDLGTWDDIEDSDPSPDHPTWDEFAADPAIGQPVGGVQGTETIDLPTRGRVYAAARVYAPKPLTAPLHIQIIGVGGEVLADEVTVPNPHQIIEWYATYTIGETGVDEEGLPWDDIEALGTYADVEAEGTWTDVATGGGGFHSYDSQVTVRLYQEGISDDTFYVDSITLYEDPIVWEFSNDGGNNWYPVYDIRNDPNGAFLFPDKGEPDENELMFRLIGARPDLHVSSLYIRPWYSTMPRGVPSVEPLNHGGAHENFYDQYPTVFDSPYFKAWNRPIPEDWWSSFRRAAPTKSLPPIPPSTPINLRLWSEEVENEPPDAPVLVEGAVDDEGFTVTWAEPDDDSGIDQYEVEVDGSTVDFTTDLEYIATGLDPDTDYVVRVRAIDTDGLAGEWSAPLTVHTDAGGAPIILNPISPFSNDNFDPATMVGTQPVLADTDDATYVESNEGQFPYDFTLEPLVGYSSGMPINLHIRISVTGDGTPVDSHGEVFIATSTGAANSADEIGGFSDGTASGFGFNIPLVDGTIQDIVVPLSMTAWAPNTEADVVAALEAGAFLDFNNIENSNWDTPPVVKVYKAWIEVGP